MRQLFLFLFLLISFSAAAQGPQKVAFGGTRPQDTAWAARHLRIDSTVKFLRYATSDTNKVLGINDSGVVVLRSKGSAVVLDTTSLSDRINARVKYVDTAAMLLPYARKASTVQYSDTAVLLAPYLKKADSGILYGTPYVLSGKLNKSDSNTTSGFATTYFVSTHNGNSDTVIGLNLASTKLSYRKPINVTNGINLADSGDVILLPDFNAPVKGAVSRIIITGDGAHSAYAPYHKVFQGSYFQGLLGVKYLFESYYDGASYYGEFKPIYDTFSCGTFQAPVTGKIYRFYGNSITAGLGVSSSYAVKFSTLVAGTLVNKGVSGMSMQNVPAWTNSFKPDSIATNDTGIGYQFIALGVNDFIRFNAGTYGFSLYGFRAAYINALNVAMSAPKNNPSNKIILITPFYIPTVTVPLALQAQYVQVVRELATSYNTGLVDMWTKMKDFPGINSMYQGDNIHPNQTLQDSIGIWLYNSDFRTQAQKTCSGLGVPLNAHPNALQQSLADSMALVQTRVAGLESSKVTNGGDSVTSPLVIGPLSNQPAWYYGPNKVFAMAITPQIAINKSASTGVQLDVHGAVKTDSVSMAEWFAGRRNDLATITGWVVPSFPNYHAGKVFRLNAGFSWFQTFDATKYLKSYDLIEGYNYNQTAVVDTFRGIDGSTTVPLATPYDFYVTRVTSPNIAMMEGTVTFSNAGVPIPKITSPNGAITVAVINNKVVFSSASGQLNVGVKPYIDRAGNSLYPRLSYFVARDSLKTNIGIGSIFTVNTTNGNIVVNNLSYTSTAPTINFGTGVGSSGVPASSGIAGNNAFGVITFVPSASPATNATVFTLTLSGAYAYTTRATLQVSPENNTASDALLATNYTTSGTTTTVTFAIRGTALIAGQTYILNYNIGGY